MNSSFKMSLVAVALVGAAVSCFAGGKVELVPISEVKISDTSVFAPAVKADVAYVLALDPDRLLAPFRREAGLPAKAKSYGNWESCGLDGHTLGHYLSALAGLIASGNDGEQGTGNGERIPRAKRAAQAVARGVGRGNWICPEEQVLLHRRL